jgi:stearoyl-CoA desaturase (delta-9 desaturase)
MTAITLSKARTGRAPDEHINKTASVPFLLIHLSILTPLVMSISFKVWVICLVLCFGRILAITSGYHRYFSHTSYPLPRVPQFLLALWGTTAAQKGPLWWLAHHRKHHRYSDTERDIHPPWKGFWWSHVGWILCDKYKETDYEEASDFAKFPELVFLNKHDMWAAWALAISVWLYAGWSGLFVGFFLSTVLCWHLTFLINSAAHRIGRRRFATKDSSRNSLILAIFLLGEGWHNNHHKYPKAARNGFYWWQIDVTYYFILLLRLLRISRDQPAGDGEPERKLTLVPQKILDEGLGRLPQELKQAA